MIRWRLTLPVHSTAVQWSLGIIRNGPRLRNVEYLMIHGYLIWQQFRAQPHLDIYSPQITFACSSMSFSWSYCVPIICGWWHVLEVFLRARRELFLQSLWYGHPWENDRIGYHLTCSCWRTNKTVLYQYFAGATEKRSNFTSRAEQRPVVVDKMSREESSENIYVDKKMTVGCNYLS